MLDINSDGTYDCFITHFQMNGDAPYAEMNCDMGGNTEVLTDAENCPLALSKDEQIDGTSSKWYKTYSFTVIMSKNWNNR